MYLSGGGVKMKKYKIKDFENWDTIGYADTIPELKKIALIGTINNIIKAI